MKSKFVGSLVELIPLRHPDEVMFPEFNRTYVLKCRKEAKQKLPLLFAHYGVERGENEWRELAFHLIADFIPGFQLEKPPKKVWTNMVRAALVYSIEQLVAEGQATGKKAAAVMLANKEPWKSFMRRQWGSGSFSGPDAGEALRRAYFQSKKLKNNASNVEGFKDLLTAHGEEVVNRALRNWMKG